MGRQHVRGGVLTIVQQKTGQEVSIPMHPNLRAALDALPRDNLTFIMSERGKPMTPEGFTNWFRKLVEGVIDDDGKRLLPDGLSPHGLRKATCRRLAEAGCSAHEIPSARSRGFSHRRRDRLRFLVSTPLAPAL